MSDEMTHSQVDELAGAFALGALDADEEAALTAHLATCDQPHLEVRDATGAGLLMAARLDPVAPSSALRDRLMGTIERIPQGPLTASPRGARRGWLDWLSPRVARPLSLAAGVALLVVGLWNVNLQAQLDQRDAALRAVARAISGSEAAFRVDGDAGRGIRGRHPGRWIRTGDGPSGASS